MSDYIVIITPTICDGTVVRWYTSETAARRGQEIVSASRNAVMVNASVVSRSDADALRHVMDEAVHTMALIRQGVNVRYLATHTQRLGSNEPIPVQPAPTP